MKYSVATLAAIGVAVCSALTGPARAQLVVGGETIADAKLFDAAKKEGHLLHYGTYPAEDAVVMDGTKEIAIHPVGHLAMSWDHRAFDGAYAAGFLVKIKETLETRDWSAEL